MKRKSKEAYFNNLNKNCLIIEDNPTDQLVMKTFLEDLKIISEVVDNFDQANKLYHEQKFDLIILDLQLMKSSGLDFLKMLNKENKVSVQTTIVTSSKKTNKDVDDSLQLGASDYIVKPVDKDIFYSKVKNLLKIERDEWFEYPVKVEENLKAKIGFDISLVSFNELGVSFNSSIPFLINHTVSLNIPLFKKNGIEKDLYKIRKVEKNANGSYKIKADFIGTTDSDRKTLRILSKTA